MKKNAFIMCLSAALLLASCGGTPASSTSDPASSTPASSQPASEPASQPASEPASQPASDPASIPASDPISGDPSSEGSKGSKGDSTESTESEESIPESAPVSEESIPEESSEESLPPEPLTSDEALDVFFENLLTSTYSMKINDGEGNNKYRLDSFGKDGYFRSQPTEQGLSNAGVMQLKDLGGYFNFGIGANGVNVTGMVGNGVDIASPVSIMLYGAYDVAYQFETPISEAFYFFEDDETPGLWTLDLEDEDIMAYALEIISIGFANGTGFNSSVFASKYATLDAVSLLVNEDGTAGKFTFDFTWLDPLKSYYELPDNGSFEMVFDTFDGVYAEEDRVGQLVKQARDYIDGEVRPAKVASFEGTKVPADVAAKLPWYEKFGYGFVASDSSITEYLLGAEDLAAYADLLLANNFVEVTEQDNGKRSFELSLDDFGETVLCVDLSLKAANRLSTKDYLIIDFEIEEGRPITGLENINAKLAALETEFEVDLPVIPASENATSYVFSDMTDTYNFYFDNAYDFVVDLEADIEDATEAQAYLEAIQGVVAELYPDGVADEEEGFVVTLEDGRTLTFEVELAMEEEEYAGAVYAEISLKKPVVIDLAWFNEKLVELSGPEYVGYFDTVVSFAAVPEDLFDLVSEVVTGQFVHDYDDYWESEYGYCYIDLLFNSADDRAAFLEGYIAALTDFGYVQDEESTIYYDADSSRVPSNYVYYFGGVMEFDLPDEDPEGEPFELEMTAIANLYSMME